MNGHERERLSAYLDGELKPGERAEVDAHLAVCPECARFLAVLEAVDDGAASLPTVAPEGYFDEFPSRVTARLGTVRRGPALLPRWTWAAAAAVLLAVVTPLTVRQARLRHAPAPAQETREHPRGGRQKDEARPGDAVSAILAPAAPAIRPQSSPAPVSAVPPTPSKALASPPKEELPMTASARREPPEGAIPAEPVDAGRAPGAERGEPALVAGAAEAFDTTRASRPAVREEESAPAAGSLESVSAAEARGPAGRAVAADEGGRTFRRLDASRPASAEAWRRLHDDWLAFAAAHPDGRRADEARVRAIEAACQAWLASGDERDEEAFRREAAAYLGAVDAQQKPRVERLVATPRPRP